MGLSKKKQVEMAVDYGTKYAKELFMGNLVSQRGNSVSKEMISKCYNGAFVTCVFFFPHSISDEIQAISGIAAVDEYTRLHSRKGMVVKQTQESPHPHYEVDIERHEWNQFLDWLENRPEGKFSASVFGRVITFESKRDAVWFSIGFDSAWDNLTSGETDIT